MAETVNINHMPENTLEVFRRIGSLSFISEYTLVGGTALAIQIGHRMSEDLDFICDSEELKINTIKRNMLKAFPESRIIRQDHNWQIDFAIKQVKVTFFSTGAIAIPFKVKSHAFTAGNIYIADKKAIAALKFSSIAHRNTFRDYYDIYCLARYHIPLLELIYFTKEHIPGLSPVTYTETLVYTGDIEEESIAGHLSPRENINKEEIAAFFTKELIRIREQI